MPRNDAFLTMPCSTCGGCGFFGSGPIGWMCPDCDGAGHVETDVPESASDAVEVAELLDAQDLAIAKMPPSMAEAMADLSAALAELRGRNLRRAA